MAFYRISHWPEFDNSGNITKYAIHDPPVQGLFYYNAENGYAKLITDRATIPLLFGDVYEITGDVGTYIVENNSNGLGVFVEENFVGSLSIDIRKAKSMEKPITIDASKGKRSFDFKNVREIREVPLGYNIK